MGMVNKQTVEQNLNNGELSEFVVALAVLAKASGTSLHEVYESLSVANGSTVGGTHAGVDYSGDGKMLPPFKEMAHFFAGRTTPNVQDVVSKCVQFVEAYALPDFSAIKCGGGNRRSKDDVTLFLGTRRVKGFSLKWKHEYPERSQDSQEVAYKAAHKRFTLPALRHSSAKGDYSPELFAAGTVMQDAVEAFHEWFARQFVERNFSAETVAAGCLQTFVGLVDRDIVYVNLSEGTFVDYSKDDTATLAAAIERGTYTYTKEATDSGRTRVLTILRDGISFIEFRTTASTDRAPGQTNQDLRRIKRQTYIHLNLP
jgi:hypothetical protein